MYNTTTQRLLKFICQITSIKSGLLPFRTCKNHIFHQEAAQLSLKFCNILNQSIITRKFFLRIITLKGSWLAATDEVFTQGKIEQLWLPLGTNVPIDSSEWKPELNRGMSGRLGIMMERIHTKTSRGTLRIWVKAPSSGSGSNSPGETLGICHAVMGLSRSPGWGKFRQCTQTVHSMEN